MRRLLLSLHDTLDILFQGLEDPARASAGRQALLQQLGGEPAAVTGLLGTLPGHGGASLGAGGVRLTAGRSVGVVAALLEALEQMVVGPFPVAVPLPSGAVMALLTRILALDDAGEQGDNARGDAQDGSPLLPTHTF